MVFTIILCIAIQAYCNPNPHWPKLDLVVPDFQGILATMDKAKQSRAALEKIASSFRALSEPTRLAILQELKAGPKTVNEIVDGVGLSQANVSKQLGILRDAGFLDREQRGTSAIYSICDPLVIDLCNLVCDRLNKRALADVETFSI
jgi:DNA-binding transcriptional ArsR family regulator